MVRQRGFTLVELVIAVSLISIALLGVAYSLQYSVRYSADPLWQSKSVVLAQAYADEILGQRFDELSPAQGPCHPCTAANNFGPEQEQRGEGRNEFDDVDDYSGLNEATLNILGEPRPEYRRYLVAVDVAYAGLEIGLSDNKLAKRIDIAITAPGQSQPLSFVFYRGNY